MNGDEVGGERRQGEGKGRHRELFALLAVFLVAVVTPSVTRFASDRLDGAFSSDPSPMEVVSAAGPATARARTAGVEISMAVGTSSSQGATATIRGSIDFADRSGTMTGPLSVMLGEGVGGSVDARMVGSVLYIRTTRITELVPGAKPWLRLDADDLLASSGAGFLAEIAPLDPDGTIVGSVLVATYFFGSTNELLGPAVGLYDEARAVGKEQVRGVSTTHYELVVNQGRFREQLIDELRQGARDMTADVWVDEDGRLRRSRLNMSVAATAGTGSGASTHEFFDLGAKVNVEEPPTGDVWPAREFLDALARARRP
jgi:hypothetical protein